MLNGKNFTLGFQKLFKAAPINNITRPPFYYTSFLSEITLETRFVNFYFLSIQEY